MIIPNLSSSSRDHSSSSRLQRSSDTVHDESGFKRVARSRSVSSSRSRSRSRPRSRSRSRSRSILRSGSKGSSSAAPTSSWNKTYRERPVIRSVEELDRNKKKEEERSRGRSRDRGSSPIEDGSGDENSELEGENFDMTAIMGFSGFGTTKQRHVEGAKGGFSVKNKRSEYRQYMNREKGFNRALSPTREDKRRGKK